MGRILFFLLGIISGLAEANGQSNANKVVTADIDHFWQAYDSIQTTKDSLKQLHFIKTLYIDKGSEGLMAFMEARDYTAELWVALINQSPGFWKSIRPNTLALKGKSALIESSIRRLKELYPELTDAKMYFTIGGLNSGGTTMADKILIGAEIATGNAQTDVSDLPARKSQWLSGVFKEQQLDNIVPLNIHEYIHTQQKGEAQDLLGLSIREGACDFITELVMGYPLQNNYIKYGRAHEAELKEQFRKEMFTSHYNKWLYNGSSTSTVGDLGYFMGYTICKSYYGQSANKKDATREIIQLNYADTAAVETFLEKSAYYTGPINKAELLHDFERNRPFVKDLTPFQNGDTLVDAATTKLTIRFSKTMRPEGYSINFGKKGKAYYPITDVAGFSPDSTSLTIKLKLEKNHEYEFMLTDRSFKSADGYPLKPFTVVFKTK